VLPATLQH